MEGGRTVSPMGIVSDELMRAERIKLAPEAGTGPQAGSGNGQIADLCDVFMLREQFDYGPCGGFCSPTRTISIGGY